MDAGGEQNWNDQGRRGPLGWDFQMGQPYVSYRKKSEVFYLLPEGIKLSQIKKLTLWKHQIIVTLRSCVCVIVSWLSSFRGSIYFGRYTWRTKVVLKRDLILGPSQGLARLTREKNANLFFFLRKKQNKTKNYHPLIPLPLVPIQTLGLNWNICLSRASSKSDIISWGHNLSGHEHWII